MKKLFLTLTALVLLSTFAQAQVFDGTIKDAKTNAGLAYVNVGVVGKAAGTVTDTEGHYKLDLSQVGDADSLRMSMIGYAPKSFSVADLKKNGAQFKTISIEPIEVQLKEVNVKNRKWKEGVLGNTTTSQSTNAGFTSNRLGNEIGIVIKTKKSPTVLKKFNASIASDVTDSVKLRLNFYSVKDGLPDQILTDRNIFVTVKRGQKAISIDLLPYNIVVDDKFFVSLEWIQNAGGRGLMFSASLFSSFMSRETSQAKWEKVGLVGIGFNVLAEY